MLVLGCVAIAASKAYLPTEGGYELIPNYQYDGVDVEEDTLE